jgi:hypothetical protein
LQHVCGTVDLYAWAPAGFILYGNIPFNHIPVVIVFIPPPLITVAIDITLKVLPLYCKYPSRFYEDAVYFTCPAVSLVVMDLLSRSLGQDFLPYLR